MFVNMWMTRDVVTVSTEASLADVAALMTRHRIRRLPVLQGASPCRRMRPPNDVRISREGTYRDQHAGEPGSFAGDPGAVL